MNNKSEKRRQIIALVSTVGVHILLLILFISFKLDHNEPRKLQGITINFGQEDGVRLSSKQIEKPEVENTPPVTGAKKEVVKGDPVLKQDQIETIAINDEKEEAVEKKIEEEKVKPDEDLLAALQQFSEASEKEVNEENLTNATKGNPDAEIGEASSTGEVGKGTDKEGFFLGDRSAVKKGIPPFNCVESGIVAVRVWVNPQGQTIKAVPGIKGTTDTSPCLMKEAKEAALQTVWKADPTVKGNQIGEIRYNFGYK